MKSVALISLGILLLLQYSCSQEWVHHSNVQRLLKDKLTSYNTNIRPLVNQSQQVHVNVTMELVAIQGIDEVEERLSVVALFVLLWPDEFMSWDPKDYGGLQEVTLKQGELWTPNLVLINPVDKVNAIDESWNILRVLYFGYIVHVPGDLFTVACQINALYYPWDTQHCTVSISTWGYGDHEIKNFATVDTIQTSYFTENGAWDFVSSSVHIEGTILFFNLVLRRKPTFVVVNVIFPVLFMALLNMLVFFIPTDSGERISYSITVLLAIAVFLTIVGDNLPKTSNPMSILSYFLVTVLAISVLIIICTIQSLRLYHRDESEGIGQFWTAFASCMKCRCCKRSHKGKRKTKDATHEALPEIFVSGRSFVSGTSYAHPAAFHRNVVLRSNRFNYERSERNGFKIYPPSTGESNKLADEDSKNTDTVNELTWKDVSTCFDYLALIFFALSIIGSVSASTIYIFTMKDKPITG